MARPEEVVVEVDLDELSGALADLGEEVEQAAVDLANRFAKLKRGLDDIREALETD